MNDNIENTGKALGWAEKMLELSRKYKWFEWAEALLIAFIVGVMILVFSHPVQVLNFFQKAATEQHTELMEERRRNSTEVQKTADRLLYTLDADRVVLLELHNGASSTAGIPFLRASTTFEALNDGVAPIATQYQATSLSLWPFANYLYETNFWIGYTEEMKKIDKSLSYRMLSNSTEYFAAVMIEGTEKPLGFLFLSFGEGKTIPDADLIQREMQRASNSIAVLLELKKN